VSRVSRCAHLTKSLHRVLEPLQLGDAPEQMDPWTLAVILSRGDVHHDSHIPYWREPVDLAALELEVLSLTVEARPRPHL